MFLYKDMLTQMKEEQDLVFIVIKRLMCYFAKI